MSHVCDVLILASVMDEDSGAIGAVEAWLVEHRYAEVANALRRVDGNAGGFKAMQATVWAGAYNYLDIPAFLAAVWAAPWDSSEYVQVALKDEHDERWRLHDFGVGLRESPE